GRPCSAISTAGPTTAWSGCARATGSASGAAVQFSDGLEARLAFADQGFDKEFRPMFDAYIAAAGIDAPSDDRRPYDDFMPTTTTELHLDAAGVGAVVWATGYRLGFGWVDVPVLDSRDTRDTSGGHHAPWTVGRRPALAAQPALLGARRCGSTLPTASSTS
ncbi:MAG TPA: hypothetical protein VF734_12310, partial [Pseudonocardiaceae bacterium]